MTRQEAVGANRKHKIQCECKKTNTSFTVKMAKALAQVAHRGGGVSVLGSIKDAAGNRPELCTLLGPGLSKETGLTALQRSLPTLTIL